MRKAAFISALALCSAAHASTMTDYATVVSWTDAKGITQFRGSCDARFGTQGVSGPLAYDLSCPTFKEAHIVVYPKTKLASIDGLPARATYPVKDTIELRLADGETLTFVLPDCTKDAC